MYFNFPRKFVLFLKYKNPLTFCCIEQYWFSDRWKSPYIYICAPIHVYIYVSPYIYMKPIYIFMYISYIYLHIYHRYRLHIYVYIWSARTFIFKICCIFCLSFSLFSYVIENFSHSVFPPFKEKKSLLFCESI